MKALSDITRQSTSYKHCHIGVLSGTNRQGEREFWSFAKLDYHDSTNIWVSSVARYNLYDSVRDAQRQIDYKLSIGEIVLGSHKCDLCKHIRER